MFRIFAVFLLFCHCAKSQTDIHVGPKFSFSSATHSFRPITSAYDYFRESAIYHGEELGGQGLITKVGFYIDTMNYQNVNAIPVKIWLKETVFDSLNPQLFSYYTNGALLVFDSILDSSMFKGSNQWLEIPFQIPFQHYANNNVIISIESNAGVDSHSDTTNILYNYYYAQNGSITWHSDSLPPVDSGTVYNSRPFIRWGITTLDSCNILPFFGDAYYYETESPDTVVVYAANVANRLGVNYAWRISFGAGVLTFANTSEPFVYYSGTVFSLYEFSYLESCRVSTLIESDRMIKEISLTCNNNNIILICDECNNAENIYEIISTDGRHILNGSINSFPYSITVSDLTNGIYILSVYNHYSRSNLKFSVIR